ncbi:MAG TPA: kynureninase, partial [Chryseolinea sp.]
MNFINTFQYAKKLDSQDTLRHLRNQFFIPTTDGKNNIYFAGNSLGLQPKSTKKFLTEELYDWANLGVEGHAHSRRPWLYYHKFTKKALGKLVGAKPHEVVAMNQLTVNLHLMMVSFYNPTPQRYKIITEAGAFPSDQYAFESQIKYHGYNVERSLIELKPRNGEYTLRTEDIITSINEHANELALVIFGGVQYYTGQLFDLKKITQAGHAAGATVGFDLAHAIGNVPLSLHDDDVDFAVWCSYKYLNSGPGSIAGIFVNERHAMNFDLPRFAGWWGHNEKERFLMEKGFKPMPGADGWQLSNVPVFQAAAHIAALEIFQQTTITALRKKSLLLTGYLEFLLNDFDGGQKYYTIITPKDPAQRGCQLSLLLHDHGKKIFKSLLQAGVILDWREP